MATDSGSMLRQVWQRIPDRPRQWLLDLRYPAPAEKQWMRRVMEDEAAEFFRSLPPGDHEALEVSGRLRADLPWKSYTSVHYPEFDLCSDEPLPESFDVVICEQVLEHVPDLTKAVQNLRRLCRPTGRLFVSTPFLVKLHGHPGDFWRLTPSGMRATLERGGFDVEFVHSWGNRSCVRRNLGKWVAYRPWQPLKNDPDLPVVVWAVARPSA